MMNWKILIPLMIIILAAGFLHFCQGIIIDRVENGVITSLEESLAVEIEYSDLDIWPLNKITISDFVIKRKDNNLLSTAELKIHYNIKEIAGTLEGFNFKRGLEALNHIELKDPRLDLDLAEEFIKERNKAQGKQNILTYLQQLRVVLDQGKMVYDKGNDNFIINNNLSTIFLTKDGFKLKSGSKLRLKQIDLSDYNLGNCSVEGITLDNINFEIVSQAKDWQASLETSYFSFKKLNDLIAIHQDKLGADKFSIKNLAGKGRLTVNLKGQDLNIRQYSGKVDLKRSKASISYGSRLQKEKIKKVTGSIKLNSENKKVYLDQLAFQLSESSFAANGHFKYDTPDQELYLNLKSYNFQPGRFITAWLPNPNLEMAGKGNLELNVRGNPTQPEISMDFYLPHGELEGELISHLKTHLRYRKGIFYLDFFNANFNQDNQLMVEGVVNNQKNGKYNFQLEGDKIALKLAEKVIKRSGYHLDKQVKNSLRKINGDINFKCTVNGEEFRPEAMNILGDFSIESPYFSELNGEVWFADQKLLISNGKFSQGKGKMNFSGEIDLAENKLDLSLSGEKIELSELRNEVKLFIDRALPEIKGTANFEAQVTDKLDNPRITSEISIVRGNMVGYNLSNLNLELSYQNKKMIISDLKAESPNGVLKGTGNIDLSQTKPVFSASISLKDLACSYLEQKSGYSLPLSGKLGGDITVKGSLQSPKISGSLFSDRISIDLNGGYKPDSFTFGFTWQKNNPLLIDRMMVKKGQSSLKASGKLQNNKINLGLKGENIKLADLKLDEKLKGDLTLEGTIKGELNQPSLSGNLNLSQLTYEQKKLDNIKGKFSYQDNQLLIDNMVWQLAESKYNISGSIEEIIANPAFNLRMNTENGNINKLLKLIGEDDLPFNIDYRLKGEALISGTPADPVVELGFSAYDKKPSESKITIQGKITDKYDLRINGNQVKLNKIFALMESETDFDISGQADFFGLISGPLNDVRIDFENEITEAAVNGIPFRKIEGKLEIKEKVVQLNQDFLLGEEGKVSVSGDLFPDRDEVDLSIISDKLPLNLFADTVSMVSEVEGRLESDINITGKMSQPAFEGELQVKSMDLSSSLPYKFKDINGELLFNNHQIEISGIEGQYGQGDVTVTGFIYPFKVNDTWDLTFKGENIPFARGSYKGLFNTEDEGIEITGARTSPLITGDLLPHDFTVEMPFHWPESEYNSFFKPQLDLTLHPGDNVYLKRKKNIDVAIQEGSLTLLLEDGDFQMEGELRSRRGDFNYYNNKFILENASAVFRRFQGLVPTLHISANTVVDGVEINVRLDGPGDNMITTFTSQPELPEKEIIQLLTQKGGIGKVLKGDVNGSHLVENFVKQEVIRLLHNTLQLDLVSNLEEKLEGALQLDRMEINTYELGINDEITIRLGKNLTDKLYVEYIGNIRSDKVDHEFSFNYLLTDYTRLEGTWMGQDNYRLSIDTTLEF